MVMNTLVQLVMPAFQMCWWCGESLTHGVMLMLRFLGVVLFCRCVLRSDIWCRWLFLAWFCDMSSWNAMSGVMGGCCAVGGCGVMGRFGVVCGAMGGCDVVTGMGVVVFLVVIVSEMLEVVVIGALEVIGMVVMWEVVSVVGILGKVATEGMLVADGCGWLLLLTCGLVCCVRGVDEGLESSSNSINSSSSGIGVSMISFIGISNKNSSLSAWVSSSSM